MTYTTPSAPAATWLIAEREIRMRLRSKAFIISTIVLMAAVLGSIVIGNIASSSGDLTKVAAVGTAVEFAESTKALDVTEVDDVAEAKQLVIDGEVDAAVVPDPDAPSGVKVYGIDEAPSDVSADESRGAGDEDLQLRPLSWLSPRRCSHDRGSACRAG